MLRVCNCKSASEDSLLVFIQMAEECGGKKRKEREKKLIVIANLRAKKEENARRAM